MAKVSVGSLCSFNHETQDWSVYKERLEQWFLANDLETEGKTKVKQRAVLLSGLTETTYKLIRDLALPKKINTLEYDEIIELLDDHFKDAKCGFAERNRFYTSTQRPSEELSAWAARVRGLAADCAFPATGLNDLLRDRFVLGMRQGPERDKLFTMGLAELTLSKALDTAQAIQSARIGAAESAPGAAPASIPRVEVPVYKLAVESPRQTRGQRAGSTSFVPIRPQDAAGACYVCGYLGHRADSCKFKQYKCSRCGDRGHLRRVCTRNKVRQHFIEVEVDEVGDDGKRNVICNISSTSGEPMRESVLVNKVKINFELDTGSAVTVIPEKIFNSHFKSMTLMPSNILLQSYNGSNIVTLGTLTLPFTYGAKTEDIQVYVVKSSGPCLLGRDFISKFNLQITAINNCTDYMEQMTIKYPKLFSNELGCYEGPKINLYVKPNSKPIFFKARQVPFALKEKVESELNRLVKIGILESVGSSDYASPIVPVLKSNGDIRLCADYSVSLNKQLVIDKYPLPRIEELFAKLHGGQKFSKLDLSQAYNQLVLSEDSQMLTCINTHKGLFKFTRLVFGLSSSAAIFQKTLEKILSGIDGVLVFQDDILVTGSNAEEHLKRLHNVFMKLERAGLVLQRNKCTLFQKSVSYLGFKIDRQGLHKCHDKVEAIVRAKTPTNITELKSFLGMVNYYRHFVKNASSVLSPLHFLLQKNVSWCWGAEHDKAVTQIKRDLVADVTLAHFDPRAKLLLTVDASPSGLGAILSQVGTDGVERPVSYASRSLSKAEQSYSQIQKEATAIIFGVRKFHQYLYGRSEPFILKTDHKPLLSIFKPDKGIPEITANRLQRYAIFLTSYNFTMEYVSSSHNTADYLSRSVIGKQDLHQQDCHDVETIDRATYVNFVYNSNERFMNIEDVGRETQTDIILSAVCKYVQSGWPQHKVDNKLKPYFMCRTELSVEKSCLVRGYKIVIPLNNRCKVLNELHIGHLGINKMKAQARNRFWWPGMSADIDRFVAECDVCATLRPTPPRAPLTPWPYPPEPWYRVHMDFLGPINNKVYLIIVDAYSKWIECFDVSTGYGTGIVICKLSEVISRFGLIKTICTDNGSSFVSAEFEDFCNSNNIIHLTSPTYHPSSNGQAESSVKIVKKAIKSLILSGINQRDLQGKLHEFLFHYRNSEHSTTGKSPAEIIFGHKLRSRLDFLTLHQPSSFDLSLESVVKNKQCSQGKYYGGKRKIKFEINETVLVKMYKSQKTYWAKGIIVDITGNSIYLVRLPEDSGQLIKRHVNQLAKYKGEEIYPVNAESTAAEKEKDVEASTELPPILLSSPVSTVDHQHAVDGTSERETQYVATDEINERPSPTVAPSPAPAPRRALRDIFIFKDYL